MPSGGPRGENIVHSVWLLLVRLTLVGLTLFSLYRLRAIITTLFVAAVIAYVLEPPVDWLCRRPAFLRFHAMLSEMAAHANEQYRRLIYHRRTTPAGHVRLRKHAVRLYASLYVFVLFFVVLWYGGKLVFTPFVQEIRAASSPQKRQQIATEIQHRLASYDRSAPPWARSDKIQEQLRKTDFAHIAQGVATEAGMRLLEGLKSIVEVVLLPVLAFYFLMDGRRLKHEFLSLVPRSKLFEAMRMINEFNRIMRAFVVGQVILCLLAGVVVGTGLALLHVEYPLIMGVLAGITRAIPIIGPILGGIPIILLTLATKGVGAALAVLVFFTLLHFVESKFIMPLLIGDRMELHPVVIIIVLVVGGEIGGLLIGGALGSLLGMFFAAPIASIVRVMVRRYWLHLGPASRPATSLDLPLMH